MLSVTPGPPPKSHMPLKCSSRSRGSCKAQTYPSTAFHQRSMHNVERSSPRTDTEGARVPTTACAVVCPPRNVDCIYQCLAREKKKQRVWFRPRLHDSCWEDVNGEVGSTVRTRALCLVSRAASSHLGTCSNSPNERQRAMSRLAGTKLRTYITTHEQLATLRQLSTYNSD